SFSSSKRASARARALPARLSGAFSVGKLGPLPTPEAAARPRRAVAARLQPTAIVAHGETGSTRRGIARTASPTTPPRPVGSGQLPGAGSRDASPAAAITPPR